MGMDKEKAEPERCCQEKRTANNYNVCNQNAFAIQIAKANIYRRPIVWGPTTWGPTGWGSLQLYASTTRMLLAGGLSTYGKVGASQV